MPLSQRQAFFGLLVLGFSLACSKSKFEAGSVVTETPEPQTEDVVVEDLEAPTESSEIPAAIAVTAEAEPVDTVASQLPKNPLFAECANEPDRPIVADLYELPVNTAKLPDYAALKSIKKICLSQLDIKSRKFSEGFPGVQNLFEWFSLDTRFIVTVPTDGVYSFKLIADDGAILYIANQKIIDNDGVHAVVEKTGTADLKAGDLSFRVSYFQGPRFDIALELMWKAPGATEFSYIPKANLKRPLN